MHVKKAIDQLAHLATEAPANLTSFAVARLLIDDLLQESRKKNVVATQRLETARQLFTVLCGLGPDTSMSEQACRAKIFQNLAALQCDLNPSSDDHFEWNTTGLAAPVPAV